MTTSLEPIIDESDEEEKTQLVDPNFKINLEISDDDPSCFVKLLEHPLFREGLVSTILLLWSCFMLPYDFEATTIHSDYSINFDIFEISLYIWCLAHILVVIASLLSLITICLQIYYKNKYINYIKSFCIILLMCSSTLQVLGGLFYAYSYCRNNNDIWVSCICKSHGLYILYNASQIMYLWCILYADQYNNNTPLQYIILITNNNNIIKFTRNFRISFLSTFTVFGMLLILIYGFDIYQDVGESYKAIYIGYSFLLGGSFIVLLLQLLFHCNLFKKCFRKQIVNAYISENNLIEPSLTINRSNNIDRSNYSRKFKNRFNQSQIKKRVEKIRTFEKLCHGLVFFLIYAGIVMVCMYSLVSKIPEAQILQERLRLIGNMVIICGTSIVISYEIFVKKENDDNRNLNQNNDYELIPTQ